MRGVIERHPLIASSHYSDAFIVPSQKQQPRLSPFKKRKTRLSAGGRPATGESFQLDQQATHPAQEGDGPLRVVTSCLEFEAPKVHNNKGKQRGPRADSWTGPNMLAQSVNLTRDTCERASFNCSAQIQNRKHYTTLCCQLGNFTTREQQFLKRQPNMAVRHYINRKTHPVLVRRNSRSQSSCPLGNWARP